MKVTPFIILFICINLSINAQEIEWKGELELLGTFSSETQNPFWFQTNSNTQLGVSSSFSGLGAIEATYSFSENASFASRMSFFYRDKVINEFQRKDVYIQFKNSWLKTTLGAKAGEVVQQGLSGTNKNFLFSENARPLSGLLVEANEPIKVSETFSIDWGIGHYYLNDHRYVNDVMIHYKRLGLNIQFNENNKLTTQIQHYAQWGGTSPEYGKLNSDFEAFVDVFFAKRSSEIDVEGELLNAVGNHLGSYLIDYAFKNQLGDFSIYHEHPFEDGSGTRLANFPDGIWGAYFQPKNSKLFSGVLYEFITTENQSKKGIGVDDYFTNTIYRSGWTYEGNSIGMPFFIVAPNLEITSINSPIISNRVTSHHFGFTGSIKKFDWKVKSSIVSNAGTYNNPFPEAIKTWYNYASIEYPTENYGKFRLFGGIDSGKLIETIAGVGLGYKYNLQ